MCCSYNMHIFACTAARIGPSERRVTKEPLHISGYIEGQLNSQSLHQKCLKTKSKSRPLDEMLHTSAYAKLQLAKSPDDQIQSEPSLSRSYIPVHC